MLRRNVAFIFVCAVEVPPKSKLFCLVRFGLIWFRLVLFGHPAEPGCAPAPSIAGVSSPSRRPLLEESADPLDRIAFGEIVDHRQGGDRVSLV